MSPSTGAHLGADQGPSISARGGRGVDDANLLPDRPVRLPAGLRRDPAGYPIARALRRYRGRPVTSTLQPPRQRPAEAPWRRPLALGLAGAGAVAYTALLDPNRSAAFPFCPLRLLTGIDCPFCGSLRATHALAHGHLAAASITTCCSWWRRRWCSSDGSPGWPPPPAGRCVAGACLSGPGGRFAAIAVVFMVARNLPWAPVHWLDSR